MFKIQQSYAQYPYRTMGSKKDYLKQGFSPDRNFHLGSQRVFHCSLVFIFQYLSAAVSLLHTVFVIYRVSGFHHHHLWCLSCPHHEYSYILYCSKEMASPQSVQDNVGDQSAGQASCGSHCTEAVHISKFSQLFSRYLC